MAEGADERLIVMLEARISEFERRMGQAERRGTRTYQGLQRSSARATVQMEADMVRSAGRINQALAAVQGGIGTFSRAFLGAFSVGVILEAARRAVAGMADIADAADAVGISVENFQGLTVGLGLAGVKADEAANALKTYTDRLGDAAAGNGELFEAMQKAGVALTGAGGAMRDSMDILRDYSDLVKDAPNQAERMGLVTAAFGRGGKAMVLAMAEGGAGIDAMIAKARESGAVIDEAMIRKAAELDDKIEIVTTRLNNMFKGAVIDAAYLFGLIDRERAKTMEFDYKVTISAVGVELADQLAALPAVTEGARVAIGSLAAEYDDLAAQAGEVVVALSNGSSAMQGLGNTGAAEALRDLAGTLADTAAAYENNAISGDEMRVIMGLIGTEANLTIAALGDLDRARLSGVTGAVADLLAWISEIPAAVADATAAINAAEGLGRGGDDMGDDMGEDRAGRRITPSRLAPTRSGRARRAPAMLGEGGAAAGGGRGGGGGGGSGAIDALLADLATEREIIGAWYTESLGLLNSATDAQLAALGGRHEAIERLETEHRGRLGQIRDMTDASALSKAGTFFGALATVTAAGGDRLAKISRTFAAAEALINTYRAQAQVLADPRLGFWAKLPAVAAIGAAGLSLVSSLGGSGRSSKAAAAGVGADNAPSVAGGASEPVTMRFLVQGLDPAKLYTGKALVDLVSAIQGEMKNRGVVWEFAQ